MFNIYLSERCFYLCFVGKDYSLHPSLNYLSWLAAIKQTNSIAKGLRGRHLVLSLQISNLLNKVLALMAENYPKPLGYWPIFSTTGTECVDNLYVSSRAGINMFYRRVSRKHDPLILCIRLDLNSYFKSTVGKLELTVVILGRGR